MNVKIAKQIYKLQGIKYKKEVKVLCPRCERKTLILNLTDDKAFCIRCDKTYYSVEEVLEIVEADYIEKHRETDYEMKNNRGFHNG